MRKRVGMSKAERQQAAATTRAQERERAAPSVRERASEGRHPCARESERRPRTLPFHFFAKRRLRRNFGSIPLIGRRCPLPSRIGFLIPLRWFLYDWLWAVWLVDFAIAAPALWLCDVPARLPLRPPHLS